MKFMKWKNPAAKYLVAAFLAVFVLLWVRECRAVEFEVGAGVSSGRQFSPFDVESGTVEVSALLDRRRWDLSVGWVGAQDEFDVGSWGYFSAQRVVRYAPVFLGLGLLVRTDADNIDELLPQEVSFSLSAGFEVDRVRVEYRHASNAGMEDPNRGVNWLLVSWVW